MRGFEFANSCALPDSIIVGSNETDWPCAAFRIDSRTLTGRKPFLETGYSYLPLAWAATLAFYLRPFLGEAGTVLKVSSTLQGEGGGEIYELTYSVPPAQADLDRMCKCVHPVPLPSNSKRLF